MGEPIRRAFRGWWDDLVDAAEARRSRSRYERLPTTAGSGFGMGQVGEEVEMMDRRPPTGAGGFSRYE